MQMILTQMESSENPMSIGLSKNIASFAILVALRETTTDLIKNMGQKKNIYFAKHYQDSTPNRINITNWFNFMDIISKKIAFFGIGLKAIRTNRRKHSINDINALIEKEIADTPVLKALSYIMSDVGKSRWGLRHMLVNLYNDDYRRFSLHLVTALNNYNDELTLFNTLWDKAKPHIHEPYNTHIIHLCRLLVLSVILNYMQNNKNEISNTKGFFDALMLIRDHDTSRQRLETSTYLRRILNYLNNIENDPTINPDKKYATFPQIIEMLICKQIVSQSIDQYSSKKYAKQIENIAEILKIACESSMINTNGVELITININRKKMNSKSLAEEMKEQWDRYLKNSDDIDSEFNVKISKAGSVITQVLPCFEFFFCRYKKKTLMPLILSKTEEQRYNLLFGDDESKDGIVDRAFFCADKSIEIEEELLAIGVGRNGNKNYLYPKWLFKNVPGSKGIVHALDILSEHRDYLCDYYQYLSSLSEAEKSEYEAKDYESKEKGNIRKLSDVKVANSAVELAIAKYNEKIRSLIETHQAYVNLGYLPI